jgi:hypothetical protein
MIDRKEYAAALLATIILAFPAAQAGNEKGSDMSSASIRINAKPEEVWKAIRNPRPLDVFSRRVVSSDKNKVVTVEDTFTQLPVLGSTKCLVSENETTACRRVDFSMIKSDKLKAFKGYWAIKPLPGGNESELQLAIFADTGVKMPFAKCITKKTMSKNIKLELAAAKEQAEASQRTAGAPKALAASKKESSKQRVVGSTDKMSARKKPVS